MQWNYIGTYNPKVIKAETQMIDFNAKKLYFTGQEFSVYDYQTKEIFIYERTSFSKLLSSYLDGNIISGVYGVGSNKFYFSGDINKLKGKLIRKSIFISHPIITNNYLIIILISSLFILLLFFFRNKLIMFLKPFNGIIYCNQKQSFLYKNKSIVIFEDQEKKVLFFLLNNLNQYISLNELNQLFENNKNAETISAVVKRREQAIYGLLNKVSKITGIEEQKLILERKNNLDKRIKDILLLPNLLKKTE
jgi:hypothetical protein